MAQLTGPVQNIAPQEKPSADLKLPNVGVWRAVVFVSRIGPGNWLDENIFLFAESFSAARGILEERTHGWKKHKGVQHFERVTDEAILRDLAEKISMTPGLTIEKAIHEGFYYERRHGGRWR
jgi:hypothetical protein